MKNSPSQGILLTNTGTPDAPTQQAVRRYLREFLSDYRVVGLPRYLWLPILHGVVLPLRSRYSAALYQKIWTSQGSPMRIYMEKLARKLQEQLNIPVEIGMHYGRPSIADGLKKLQEKKAGWSFRDCSVGYQNFHAKLWVKL